MDKGIWKIAEAWICPVCRAEMAAEYVIRELGPMQRRTCQRCGKESPSVKKCKYTMGRASLERIGRLEG